MKPLSDEQLDMIESELLQPGAHITGRRTYIPAMIAELRALRAVAEAASVVSKKREDGILYGHNALYEALAAWRALGGE